MQIANDNDIWICVLSVEKSFENEIIPKIPEIQKNITVNGFFLYRMI